MREEESRVLVIQSEMIYDLEDLYGFNRMFTDAFAVARAGHLGGIPTADLSVEDICGSLYSLS